MWPLSCHAQLNLSVRLSVVCDRWNRESHKGKQKWESLEHNGVLFPAAYVAHGVPLLYDGSELRLSEEAEEVATMYASMLELSEFIGNPTFNSNFFKDWRSVMSKAERQTIQKLDKCNFTRMHQHVMAEREKKKAAKKVRAQPHDAHATRVPYNAADESRLLTDCYVAACALSVIAVPC